MRDKFKALCETKKETTDKILAVLDESRVPWSKSEKFIDLCHDVLRKQYPKSFVRCRRENAPKVLEKKDKELYDLIQGSMTRGMRFLYGLLQDDKEQLKKGCERLVEAGLRPLAGDKRVKLDEVWESSYSSQGFGARQYAEGSAKLRALNAQALGIKTEVETTVRRYERDVCWSGTRETATFHVWVSVDHEIDVELIKLCPAMTLREQVKACWANHINPRVYNAFLPFGYEEQVGLDYFGNDVSSAAR